MQPTSVVAKLPEGFEAMRRFPLLDALLGRRSRRFFRGAELPDGVFRYKSRHRPMPLDEVERNLVLMACGGATSWHHLIFRADRYAPHLSNYAAAALGRTFPSSAGFHTSRTFFTDDAGVYVLDDASTSSPGKRDARGRLELDAMIEQIGQRVRKLDPFRASTPSGTSSTRTRSGRSRSSSNGRSRS